MRQALETHRRTHPHCQHPNCPRLADHTDHIVPLAEGGDRYNPTNMQSLCTHHHAEKTTRDALRGKRRPR
jgi:5-methylcytosine-specific restriction endonuclease McrA